MIPRGTVLYVSFNRIHTFVTGEPHLQRSLLVIDRLPEFCGVLVTAF
jgi:hypothetical protein